MRDKEPTGRQLTRRQFVTGGGVIIIAGGVVAKIAGVFDRDEKEHPKTQEPTASERAHGNPPEKIHDAPKHVVFPDAVDPEIKKAYTEALNGTIELVLENDKEMIETYRAIEIHYYPVPDLLRAIRERIGNAPDVIANSTMLVAEDENGKIYYEILIDQRAFQNAADLIAAIDHELRHARNYAQGKKFPSWTDSEVATFSEGIEALTRMRDTIITEHGPDYRLSQELERVIANEKRALEHWRSGKNRSFFDTTPKKKPKNDAPVDSGKNRDWDVHLRNNATGRRLID